MESYNMGLITNNERYNQIIDIWTNINYEADAGTVLEHADQGRRSGLQPGIHDAGLRAPAVRRSRSVSCRGMRGLMAKPQKSGVGGRSAVIENPILSNFKEGLSVLEYFISTHGARKGLADTALEDRRRRLSDTSSGGRCAGT